VSGCVCQLVGSMETWPQAAPPYASTHKLPHPQKSSIGSNKSKVFHIFSLVTSDLFAFALKILDRAAYLDVES
jgi:hypothetical protein